MARANGNNDVMGHSDAAGTDDISTPSSPTLSQISVSSNESVSSTSTGGGYHGVVGRMELKWLFGSNGLELFVFVASIGVSTSVQLAIEICVDMIQQLTHIKWLIMVYAY